MEEIKEALNQSQEYSTQKKLEEAEEESDDEAELSEDMKDESGLVADMSGFCLKNQTKSQKK